MNLSRTGGLLLAALIALCAQTASAGNFGGYLDLGVGSGSVTEDDSLFFVGHTWQVKANSLGLGATFDVDARTARVFDFRLRGGFDSLSLKDDENQNLALNGWVAEALFTLGGKVGDGIRLWVGPTLQSGYYKGSMAHPSDPTVRDYDAWFLSLAMGVSAGANIPLSSGVTLCPVIGWRHTFMAGDYDYDSYPGDGSHHSESGSLDAETNLVHFSLDLLF